MNAGAYLWLGLVGLLLVFLSAAFAYLTLRRRLSRFRRHQPLREGLHRLDAWLARKAPRVRRVLRRRFTLSEWHGLALTVASALLLGFVGLFAVITEGWTSQDDLYQIDRVVHRYLDGMLSETTIELFRIATFFGDGVVVALIGFAVAAFLFYQGDRWRLVALLIVVGVGQGVLVGLKWIFARARPSGRVVEAGFYSFPSGHSFSAMVLYGFLIFLIWRYAKREAVRLTATVGFVLLITLVGLSRVVLSVHWVSDVLGGFTIGLAWLVCGLTATRALQAYWGTSRAKPYP